MTKILCVSVVLSSALSFAQATPHAPAAKHIEFDPDLIESEGVSASVEVVTAAPALAKSSLIKMRENFDDKVMQSVHQL